MTMMYTTIGLIEEDQLQKESLTEDCPSGKSVTTKYFHQGVLVRQDVTIHVSAAGLKSDAHVGQIQ